MASRMGRPLPAGLNRARTRSGAKVRSVMLITAVDLARRLRSPVSHSNRLFALHFCTSIAVGRIEGLNLRAHRALR